MTDSQCVDYLENICKMFVNGSKNCEGQALEYQQKYISAIRYAIAKVQSSEAEQLRDIGEVISCPKQLYNEPVKNCLNCAEEHEQLAEWLKELKSFKEGEECMEEDAKQASIPYTYNAPQHDWKCGYPDSTRGKKNG